VPVGNNLWRHRPLLPALRIEELVYAVLSLYTLVWIETVVVEEGGHRRHLSARNHRRMFLFAVKKQPSAILPGLAPVVPMHSDASRAYGAVLVSPVPAPECVEPLMPFGEFEPPIEPGEALGDALLPYGALLPPLLNPALGSEPLPEGAEVVLEDVDGAPGAVPPVPTDGAVLEPDALEPAPLLVSPILPDCANAAGTKAASANVNDELSANAISDFFILITCSSPLFMGFE
jgi:hypothetical protein